jgi:hypothetical protein
MMKLPNTTLILSAVAIALLATPAFAQRAPRYPSHRAGAQMQYRDPPGNSYNAYSHPSSNPENWEW